MNLNFDISSFPWKLIGAIVYSVGALFAFALFPTFVGAGQGIHLEARDDGSCEYQGQRFDRVVIMNDSSDRLDANEYDWGSYGGTVTQATNACEVAVGAMTSLAAHTASSTVSVLTATGNEIKSVTVATAFTAGNADGKLTFPTTAEWESPKPMFNDNRSLVNIIIGAMVLIIGIGPIIVIGMIGYKLLGMFAGGMSGPAKFLVAALGAVIAVSLLSTFTDFISIAYNAVDADRFTAFGTGLASLAATIRQFWAVIFVASFVGLGGYYGWGAAQQMRGRGRGRRGGRAEGSMMG